MEHFRGKVLEGEKVLFRRVSGTLEEDDGRGGRFGQLEVHEGSPPMLVISRPYRLARDDGRSEEIFITGLCLSEMAGTTILAFRATGGTRPQDRHGFPGP